MAGNYLDAPHLRMAHDRDGTAFVSLTGGGSSQYALSTHQILNNDNTDAHWNQGNMYGSDTQTFGIIFPEQRDIFGILLSMSHPAGTLYTSPNTTNGIDGTWESRGATSAFNEGLSKVSFRNNVNGVSWLGVKGFQWQWTRSNGHWHAKCHVYGMPSAGQNPDRLRFWHPTLDQEVGGAYFDWGDTPRSSSADRSFRVKNNSATLTANSIVISSETLTDANPSLPGQHLFSIDHTNFSATINIGSLGPGVISPQYVLRRVTPSDAALSLWTLRMLAEATSGWTS